MTATALDWLRSELAADLDAARGRTLGEWCRVAVDTALMPGLFFRAMVHSIQYGINCGEQGAELSYSMWEAPLQADGWRVRDDIQATVLAPILWGLVAQYARLPSDPVLLAGVVAVSLPILVDPLRLLAHARGEQ